MSSFKNLSGSNVHILMTKSNLAEIYVYDTLKEKCKASNDSIYTVNSKSVALEMLDLVNLQPFLADKWLFVIDYYKVKSILKERKGLFESDSSEFLIKVRNYSEFKEVKSLLSNVNDMYLQSIKFLEVDYLLSDFGLSPKLVEFIAKSYYNEPEQVFRLRNHLLNGGIISKKKDVVDLCGVSSGSVISFALSLLGEPPKSDKGKKSVYKRRLSLAYDLAEAYGISKFRNFLMASVQDIMDIKTLHMVGAIYDRIDNLPNNYDKDRLSKYSRFLGHIIDIPYSRISRLFFLLKKNSVWYSDLDMINFIYQYYEGGSI